MTRNRMKHLKELSEKYNLEEAEIRLNLVRLFDPHIKAHYYKTLLEARNYRPEALAGVFDLTADGVDALRERCDAVEQAHREYMEGVSE